MKQKKESSKINIQSFKLVTYHHVSSDIERAPLFAACFDLVDGVKILKIVGQ